MRGAALALLASMALAGCHAAASPLRVCADPNNLPFSARDGSGFENRLAEMIGHELHRPVVFVWWAQRRGFSRNTLGERRCDIWPGVATGLDSVATSRPWYRAPYVFVTRADRPLAGLTLDDPRLRRLRLGVQMIGDDGANTPPAEALARRGIVGNVRGFLVYGDYRRANPPTAIVEAVAAGAIDAALAWGPMAGWSARRSPVPLRVEPITPWLDGNRWPMAFDVSVGLRKDEPTLLRAVDGALTRRRGDIARLLAAYGVPAAPGA